MVKISLIVAADENNVIGGDNQLLWHIPEDLKFFKAKTLGKPIIMGRKTFESIGRPLPGRTNIVITRNPEWQAPKLENKTKDSVTNNVITALSLPDALKAAQNLRSDEICIIGGGTVYDQALQFATSVYLTRVHNLYNGDTRFPELNPNEWQLIHEQQGNDCAAAGINYTFLEYKRK